MEYIEKCAGYDVRRRHNLDRWARIRDSRSFGQCEHGRCQGRVGGGVVLLVTRNGHTKFCCGTHRAPELTAIPGAVLAREAAEAAREGQETIAAAEAALGRLDGPTTGVFCALPTDDGASPEA